jgi:hypothetical protein
MEVSMLIRKTLSTKQKRIFRRKLDDYKEAALYRVTTYWFLFLPFYSFEEILE